MDGFLPRYKPTKSSVEDVKSVEREKPLDNSPLEPGITPPILPEETKPEIQTPLLISATSIDKLKPKKFNLRMPKGRREWLLVLVVVVFVSSAVFGWMSSRTSKAPETKVTTKIVVKPKIVVPVTVASTLSGLIVDPSLNARPVIGVMIENSEDARPQSGLSQAGVVFEAIAEGGITRFLALYQDNAPDDIGPIRSARPYYVQWALGFDAAYAHVGGSPEAIANIRDWGVKDLDQFYNSNSYRRVSNRFAPHNVYSGINTLMQTAVSKGYSTSNFVGFERKIESAANIPTARTININISSFTYNTSYIYDPVTNSYPRSEAAAPHIDANTNVQLNPKVVIALVMPYSTGGDGYHSEYLTIGTGQAFIFQDGLITIGQWSKASNTSQLSFTDVNGLVIKLNPGQTWITAVANATAVIYAP